MDLGYAAVAIPASEGLSFGSTLETTQGQIDGFFSRLQFKFYLAEVASVGNWLKICPWVASRVV
jgi:hypothetical protein